MEPLSTDSKELLVLEHSRLVRVLEAFEGLEKSKEWETLKELVFSKSLQAIERQLLNESLNSTVDTIKIYRLQGEWAWAKRYNEVNRFIESIKKQLADIKNKIQ